MIAILRAGVPQDQVDNLIHWLESQGLKIHLCALGPQAEIGLSGGLDRQDQALLFGDGSIQFRKVI